MERSNSDRGERLFDIPCMQNLRRNDTQEFTYRKRLTDLEIKLIVARGQGWGEGIVGEFGMDMCTLPYFKWMSPKTYCIAQGTGLNVMWQPGWEGSLGENGYMCMHG